MKNLKLTSNLHKIKKNKKTQISLTPIVKTAEEKKKDNFLEKKKKERKKNISEKL
jgi:hypothetical protein